MLDEKNEKILSRILNNCEGKYKIFDREDFSDIGSAEQSIDFLSNNGYILIRFSRQNEYLIAPTQKGSEYFYLKKQKILRNAVLTEILRKNAFKGGFWGVIIGNVIMAFAFIIFLLLRGFNAF